MYGTAAVFYLIVNFHFKLLALMTVVFIKDKKLRDILTIPIIMALIGVGLPFFVIQKSIVWNSIQFSYISLFLLGSLLPIFFASIIKNQRIVFGILFCITLILLPGVFYSLRSYAHPPYAPKIEDGVIGSSILLKSKKFDGVLLHPKFANNDLVSALSGKSSYFSEQEYLSAENGGLYQEHKQKMNDFFNLSSEAQRSFLNENNLHYILVPNDTLKDSSGFIELFRGAEAVLYEIT
jgi:hypothetical protein